MALKICITNNKNKVGKSSVAYTLANTLSYLQKENPSFLPEGLRKNQFL